MLGLKQALKAWQSVRWAITALSTTPSKLLSLFKRVERAWWSSTTSTKKSPPNLSSKKKIVALQKMKNVKKVEKVGVVKTTMPPSWSRMYLHRPHRRKIKMLVDLVEPAELVASWPAGHDRQPAVSPTSSLTLDLARLSAVESLSVSPITKMILKNVGILKMIRSQMIAVKRKSSRL